MCFPPTIYLFISHLFLFLLLMCLTFCTWHWCHMGPATPCHKSIKEGTLVSNVANIGDFMWIATSTINKRRPIHHVSSQVYTLLSHEHTRTTFKTPILWSIEHVEADASEKDWLLVALDSSFLGLPCGSTGLFVSCVVVCGFLPFLVYCGRLHFVLTLYKYMQFFWMVQKIKFIHQLCAKNHHPHALIIENLTH